MAGNEAETNITIQHLVFDHIEFTRFGFRGSSKNGLEIPVQLATSIKKTDEGEYTVTLRVSIEKEDEYTAEVTISGYCMISEDNPRKEALLRENVPAILLPYARAQLTMLTAQPEMEPVILPVINIHDMVNKRQE